MSSEHRIRNLMQVAGVMVDDLKKVIHYEEEFEDGSTASQFSTEPNFEAIEKICIAYSESIRALIANSPQADHFPDVGKMVADGMANSRDMFEQFATLHNMPVLKVGDAYSNDDTNYAWWVWQKALSNTPQADGMVLVPIEPKDEQINAGRKYFDNTYDWTFLGLYKAMLSAYKPQADDVRKDAERYRWLRDNNATVIEVQEEKRGYRSTVPDASRERWFERSGWNVSTLPMTLEFKTMDEAVDFAIDKARE